MLSCFLSCSITMSSYRTWEQRFLNAASSPPFHLSHLSCLFQGSHIFHLLCPSCRPWTFLLRLEFCPHPRPQVCLLANSPRPPHILKPHWFCLCKMIIPIGVKRVDSGARMLDLNLSPTILCDQEQVREPSVPGFPHL